MATDEAIREEMRKVLRRKRRICPNTMLVDELARVIDAKFPDMDAFEIALAVFKLSRRKLFTLRTVGGELVVCLKETSP